MHPTSQYAGGIFKIQGGDLSGGLGSLGPIIALRADRKRRKRTMSINNSIVRETKSEPAIEAVERKGHCLCGNDEPGTGWPCNHGICGWEYDDENTCVVSSSGSHSE